MDDSFVRVINLFWTVVMVLVPIVVLCLATRRGWAVKRAWQMSQRAQLPFLSEPMHARLCEAIRHRTTMAMRVFLASIVVFGVAVAVTPLGLSPYATWWFLLILVCGVLALTGAVYEARHPLFPQPPGSVRVARPHVVRVSDYLGRLRTLLPRALLALGIAASSAVALVGAARQWAPVGLAVAATAVVVAIAVSAWTAMLERRVLARAQPAADRIELAWDDLFRTNALRTLRMAAAMASWLPAGAALMVAVSAGQSAPLTTAWFVYLGIPMVQLVYSFGAGRLPRGLRPVLVGSPA